MYIPNQLKLIHPTAYSLPHAGCLIYISKLTCPKLPLPKPNPRVLSISLHSNSILLLVQVRNLFLTSHIPSIISHAGPTYTTYPHGPFTMISSATSLMRAAILSDVHYCLKLLKWCSVFAFSPTQ